jgi:hypothetical protein
MTSKYMNLTNSILYRSLSFDLSHFHDERIRLLKRKVSFTHVYYYDYRFTLSTHILSLS